MRMLAVALVVVHVGCAAAQDVDALRKDIASVAAAGTVTAAGQSAWKRLVEAGAGAVPLLLEAMDTPSVAQANWFYTAIDRIVLNEGKSKTKIDLDRVLAFVKDARRQGRARRIAMEIVEQHRPGTMTTLLPGWAEDPEFRPDALDLLLAHAKKSADAGNKGEALRQYRLAFEHSRDIEQARKAAAGLLDAGIEVSIARHLGFLMDWHVVGPFDSKGNKGYHLSYPPEDKVDLKTEYEARGKKLTWKPLHVVEPSPRVSAKHVALVSLRDSKALGDADDAVAFAYAELTLGAPLKAEFRGAADDNFTVWVNGKREFGFEEYRNGVRFDRHRFKADLKAGVNSVLVKICQTPAPNPEPNWEFLLRVVDENGKGLRLDSPKK